MPSTKLQHPSKRYLFKGERKKEKEYRSFKHKVQNTSFLSFTYDLFSFQPAATSSTDVKKFRNKE